MNNPTPRNRRAPLIVLSVVVVLLLATTFYVRRQSAQHDRAAEEERAVATDVAADAAAIAQQPRLPLHAPLPQAARKVQDFAAARARDREAVAAENARIKTALVNVYRNEKVDAAWAAPQEQRLRAMATDAAIADSGATPRDLDVQCKRTTCRMTAAFDSNGQADDWVLLYMSGVGSALQNSMVSRTRNADGSVAIEIHSKAR